MHPYKPLLIIFLLITITTANATTTLIDTFEDGGFADANLYWSSFTNTPTLDINNTTNMVGSYFMQVTATGVPVGYAKTQQIITEDAMDYNYITMIRTPDISITNGFFIGNETTTTSNNSIGIIGIIASKFSYDDGSTKDICATAPTPNTNYYLIMKYRNRDANAYYEVQNSSGVKICSITAPVRNPGDVTRLLVGVNNSQKIGVDNIGYAYTETTADANSIKFKIFDENTGYVISGASITLDGNTITTDSNGLAKFDLTSFSNTLTNYTITITTTNYSTRYYQVDLNSTSSIYNKFAIINSTIDVDVPFKVYETDETTLFLNTYVEIKDKDTNHTIGRLKTNSSGEATFNLKVDDSNYWTIVNDGTYIYSPVTLTILYPKDEETLAQITEKWKIEISQNLYAYYPDLNTTRIVYLLPNTALPYNIKIGDMNSNYFQRTYSQLYPGNPLTDTLQPYLVKTATGLLTTITTKNAITNTNISGVTIKIYKFIPGQGRTLVEQVTTDNKGQAISLLVLGAEYDFECYIGVTFIKTYTITATSSTIFIYLQPSTETPEISPSGFAVKYTPTYSGLNKLNVGTQVFTQTGFNNYGVSVTYTSQIIQGGILSSQSYTGSDANKTFSHTINWVDINNDVPVVSRVTITYGGKNYVYQTNYIVNDSFGTNYNLLEGLSIGLRSDAGCESTGICFPLMTIALLLSIGLTIWVAISMGQLGQQTAGIVLLLAMVVFTYLSWIPFELTVACVLILLAFVVNERRN